MNHKPTNALSPSTPERKTPKARRDEPAPEPATPHAEACPVVGIGASAGGLEALMALFDAMPDDTGLAFLIVMHLDPERESQLALVLGRHTRMPVTEAADGVTIEPGHIYVIAPGSALTVADGRLSSSEPDAPRGHRHPIDALFASLAEHEHDRAICIVLSGTGADGTEGLRDVKAQGGFILIQDPVTARFDAMPRSAIDAALADHVLAPEAMPAVLLRHVRHDRPADDGAGDAPIDGAAIEAVLALLRVAGGHDFGHYKRGTLKRRVHRRMGLRNLDAVADYTALLRRDRAELAALVKDLMINVTGFFRDPKAWKSLEAKVLGPLVASHDADAPIRIWVCACSTGEEAYSIAMLMVEQAERAGKVCDIRVFASDSRDDNLVRARAGIYPEAVVAAIPPERLLRFFDKVDAGFQVKKAVRDLVVFATHDLLRDPPFSRLDLITCRNLMIYLDQEAQRHALALLHFALREGGHLFLGAAETAGREDDLFTAVSDRHRIYRRLGPTRTDISGFPTLTGAGGHLAAPAASAPDGPPARVADLARRALLNRFAPASVLIDRNGRAHWFHGATGDYLEQPPGEPSRDLVAMARPSLRAGLRDAVRRATTEGGTVTFAAPNPRQGPDETVTVTVAPADVGQEQRMLLVSFQAGGAAPSAPTAPPRDAGDRERGLEEELSAARSDLLATVEQFEQSNYDLKFANAEVTSMNEELQSTNEELETSKEELQSFNEELQTVNSLLQNKIEELENAKDTLNNLILSGDMAKMFLDRKLCIRWFSPAIHDLIGLVGGDVGRPIGAFAWKFSDPALIGDAEAVLRDLTALEAEVPTDDGRWFLRRLLPYRTHDDRIDGVVVSFLDITDRKRSTDAVAEARRYAEATVQTVRHPIIVLDAELRVQSVNPAFSEAFGCPAAECDGFLLEELDHGAWDIPELRRLLREVLAENEEFEGYAIEHAFPRLGRKDMLLNGRKLMRDGRPTLILLAVEDVTLRVRAEAQTEMLVRELSHRVKNMLAMVQSIGTLTARRSASIEDFNKAFQGRLRALAGAHELLVHDDWSGAELGQLAHGAMAPFAFGDRIAIEGPELLLNPESGVAMAMVLHELATNAVKYGALSKPSGVVRLSWTVEGDGDARRVDLRWVETGGPPVAEPSRKGFGTLMIERSVTHQLDGEAALDFQPDGLRYTLTFPWKSAVASS